MPASEVRKRSATVCRSAAAAGVLLFAASAASLVLDRRARAELRELAPCRAPGAGERVLLIAPHPDDESLAAAGYTARAIGNGARVRVLFLTRGDGFRAAAASLSRRRGSPGPAEFVQLGNLRVEEARAAASRLGLGPDHLTVLGFPDRGLAPLWLEFWAAPRIYRSPYTGRALAGEPDDRQPPSRYTGEALLAEIRRELNSYQPGVVLIPSQHDEHPDHWAGHVFAVTALAQAGLLDTSEVLTYLVHREGWPRAGWPWPDVLLPPRDLRAEAFRSLSLTEEERRRKTAAMHAHATQMRAMGSQLRPLARQNELFALFKPQAPAGTGRPEAALGFPSLSLQHGRLEAEVRLPAHSGALRCMMQIRAVSPTAVDTLEQLSVGTPSRGVTSSVDGAVWRVSRGAPPESGGRTWFWVGAVGYPAGKPVENLGWRLWRAAPGPISRAPVPRPGRDPSAVARPAG